MAYWWVEYSQEAATYLEDNGKLITALFFAMEAMAENDGWPQSGYIEIGDGFYLFYPEGHLVTFGRDEENQVVKIAVIKPMRQDERL